MPTFSPDEVTDFLVTEAVIRAGLEAKREAHKSAENEAEADRIREGHRKWAEESGVLEGGVDR